MSEALEEFYRTRCQRQWEHIVKLEREIEQLKHERELYLDRLKEIDPVFLKES